MLESLSGADALYVESRATKTRRAVISRLIIQLKHLGPSYQILEAFTRQRLFQTQLVSGGAQPVCSAAFRDSSLRSNANWNSSPDAESMARDEIGCPIMM